MKILIQGAFLEEINELLSFFNPQEHSKIASYEFWEINYKNHSIIISLTQKGIINASIATTIAIQKFNPDLIINQGCAGGHVSKLKLGDIVIGESSKYINDFKTPIKQNPPKVNSKQIIKKTYKKKAGKIEILEPLKSDVFTFKLSDEQGEVLAKARSETFLEQVLRILKYSNEKQKK